MPLMHLSPKPKGDIPVVEVRSCALCLVPCAMCHVPCALCALCHVPCTMCLPGQAVRNDLLTADR